MALRDHARRRRDGPGCRRGTARRRGRAARSAGARACARGPRMARVADRTGGAIGSAARLVRDVAFRGRRAPRSRRARRRALALAAARSMRWPRSTGRPRAASNAGYRVATPRIAAAASPWQLAHDRSRVPSLRFHSASPSLTHSIPGFCASSRCIACVAGLMVVEARAPAHPRHRRPRRQAQRTRRRGPSRLASCHRDRDSLRLREAVVALPT